MQEITTPDWVKHAVFYQIFPDRFAQSKNLSNYSGLKFSSWDSIPTEKSFHGGDLYGIIEKLNHLTDLGINAIYLNPIFASTSNHRYNTFDFFKVDPLLGGDDAFRELISKAHDNGIKIILDAVLNHTGRGFWQFNHILENGINSPFIDWFIIHNWPLRPYSNNKMDPINYEAWWGYPELPKLNTNNPEVQEFLFEMTKHWMGFGIDGWRMDVPMEINAPGFWEKYRSIVKECNPDAYIVGEVWTQAKDWLRGDRFDAVMNYPFAKNAINFFGSRTLRQNEFSHDQFNIEPIESVEFGKRVNEMINLYDWSITTAQLNLLDSHDTPRALWMMGDDLSAMKLAVLFQMTMPGAPCIYYGDELGLSSAGDPFCRGTIPWDQPEKLNYDLHNYYKMLIKLRNENEILRIGSFKEVFSENGVYSYLRTLNHLNALVIINSNQESKKFKIDNIEIGSIRVIWEFGEGRSLNKLNDKYFDIPAREGVIIFFEGLGLHEPEIEIVE